MPQIRNMVASTPLLCIGEEPQLRGSLTCPSPKGLVPSWSLKCRIFQTLPRLFRVHGIPSFRDYEEGIVRAVGGACRRVSWWSVLEYTQFSSKSTLTKGDVPLWRYPLGFTNTGVGTLLPRLLRVNTEAQCSS